MASSEVKASSAKEHPLTKEYETTRSVQKVWFLTRWLPSNDTTFLGVFTSRKGAEEAAERYKKRMLKRTVPAPFAFYASRNWLEDVLTGLSEAEILEKRIKEWKADGTSEKKWMWQRAVDHYQSWLDRRELVESPETKKSETLTPEEKQKAREALFHLCDDLDESGDITRYNGALFDYPVRPDWKEVMEKAVVINGPRKTLYPCKPGGQVWLVADGGHGARDCWYMTDITSDETHANLVVTQKQSECGKDNMFTCYGTTLYPLDRLIL